jgi:hypothetical protein
MGMNARGSAARLRQQVWDRVQSAARKYFRLNRLSSNRAYKNKRVRPPASALIGTQRAMVGCRGNAVAPMKLRQANRYPPTLGHDSLLRLAGF